MTFIIFIIIYVVSIFWLRHETVVEYQREYRILEPEATEMLLCFIPVMNTIGAIISFVTRVLDNSNLVKKFFKKQKSQERKKNQ